MLHPSPVLHKFGVPPAWLVYHDVQLTSQEYIRDVSKISPRWLVELAPHFYSLNDAIQGGDSGQVGLPATRGAWQKQETEEGGQKQFEGAGHAAPPLG